jgi:hypothetical protein
MVFHLLPDLDEAIAEALRVLKSSGRMVIQMQGGGDVAGSYMAVFHQAWREILPEKDPPQLVSKITVDTVADSLTSLEVQDFDIRWSHTTRRLPEPAVPNVLEFCRLVLGYWRWDLDMTTAERIEQLMLRVAKDKVAKKGYWEAVGNVLIVEATKPSL